jgi:hypothetical protein
MIQKIKLLQTEMAQAILNAEMGEPHLQQVRVMEWKKALRFVSDTRTKALNRISFTNDNLKNS